MICLSYRTARSSRHTRVLIHFRKSSFNGFTLMYDIRLYVSVFLVSKRCALMRMVVHYPNPNPTSSAPLSLQRRTNNHPTSATIAIASSQPPCCSSHKMAQFRLARAPTITQEHVAQFMRTLRQEPQRRIGMRSSRSRRAMPTETLRAGHQRRS